MNTTSAVCLPAFDFDVDRISAGGPPRFPALHVAPPAGGHDAVAGHRPAHPVTLRRLDLVADLRRARAERLADRYEWLALRRRRAQIAARHAVGE